jgi:hypothetical protein
MRVRWKTGPQILAVLLCGAAGTLGAEESGLYTDPSTGIVYRKEHRTVERPVVEERTERREQTIYRPRVVTAEQQGVRTVYSPVVRYEWQPRWHGRWNPFVQPSLGYELVPRGSWEARTETYSRPETRTEWVAEKQTVDVPQRLVRMERQSEEAWVAVGRTTPPGLQPLPGGPPSSGAATQIAQANVMAPPVIPVGGLGRMGSDPPRRTTTQGGMSPSVLAPGGSVYSDASPPAYARLPAGPVWR